MRTVRGESVKSLISEALSLEASFEQDLEASRLRSLGSCLGPRPAFWSPA